MRVLGLCRFSLVFEKQAGFPKLRDLSLDERQSIVFAKDRLHFKLRLFEHCLLPTLCGQTDRDFEFSVLITENLPTWAHERLVDLTAHIANVRLVTARVAGRLDEACRASVDALISPTTDRWATFRIDDDDGLANDYVSRLRKHLDATEETKVVTFTPGLELDLRQSGAGRFDARPFSGAAMALLHLRSEHSHADKYPTSYQLGGHRKVAEKMPAQQDAAALTYLRLIHPFNISGASHLARAQIRSGRVAKLLSKHFPDVVLDGLMRQP